MTKTHRARKRFGQNFLNDDSVIENILQALHAKDDEVIIEIGPGLGALTIPLLKAIGKLTVVEIDRDIIPKLTQACQSIGELHIHQEDALKVDYCALCPPQKKCRLIGNLPYNISTPLIFHLLDQQQCIHDMHFMLQKEVVDRMVAQPHTKNYGRLTIMVQYLCRVTALFDVPPTAFTPAPKVTSSVVRLEPHSESPYPEVDRTLLQKIVTTAFNQRRKTIRNSLKTVMNSEGLERLGLDPKARAENLTIEDYLKICKNIPL